MAANYQMAMAGAGVNPMMMQSQSQAQGQAAQALQHMLMTNIQQQPTGHLKGWQANVSHGERFTQVWHM